MEAPMFERVVETLLFPTRIADSVGRLVAEIEPVTDDVRDIRLSVDGVPERLASVDARVQPVSALQTEITEIRGLLERLTLQVERLADRMPDLDSPGPLERAREAITGKDHT
jgi:archaellum component FlaC